jgi:periplasmic protein CpxP/Spy
MFQMIRSKALAAGAAVALTAGLAVAAIAQDGPQGRRGGPGDVGRGGFPLGQLDLTEAQRTQVRDVMQRHRDEMAEAGRRLRAAHDAQREAIETVPVNEALVRSTSQGLAAAQTDMAVLQARVHSEIHQLLTPEQQAKAKELKAQRESRQKQRQQRQRRRQQQQ